MTELSLGVGVPTSAAPGDDPAVIAQEAERLGYDFVSAADHPCGTEPSYETTTMLTWIAAHTSRIKVASRVLAVPFRSPAMVAKLAASLDLLSGGRFILGLGGGYSDQEIAALGGPVLSPAEKIGGLAEAIQVIRGAWTHSGYTQHGRHHSVRDLEMEPKPTRPIPVWLGTFGPRALAVTGRLADGWIPSLGYMPVDDPRHAAPDRRRSRSGRPTARRDPRNPQREHPHRSRCRAAARYGHWFRQAGGEPATRPPGPRLHRIQLHRQRPRPDSEHAADSRGGASCPAIHRLRRSHPECVVRRGTDAIPGWVCLGNVPGVHAGAS